MRKFLCYDTNDAASGKIDVDSNGVLSPNATVPSTNGTPYQQLVTDGEGNAKWEDRLAYEEVKTGWKTIINSSDVNWQASGGAGGQSMMQPYNNTTARIEPGCKYTVECNVGMYEGTANSYGVIKIDDIGLDISYVDYSNMFMLSTPDMGSPATDISFILVNVDVSSADIKKIDPKFIPSELNEIIIPSSTSGSSKKFKITVDDSGTISATEV